MRPDERRHKILELIRQRERVAVEELSAMFGASYETIRRDLAALSGQGLVNKYHGGASLPPSSLKENAFQTRMHESAAEKRAIANAAAALFSPNDSLFIDTGTTTLFFAQALANIEDLTVITNSSAIATTVGAAGHRTFLIGGEYHADAGENLGPLAIEQVGRFNAEHAVLTIGALDREGAMDFSIEEAEMARAMVARVNCVTVIADSSKLGRRALFHLLPLDRIDRLVVDRPPSTPLHEALIAAGVEVVIAPPT